MTHFIGAMFLTGFVFLFQTGLTALAMAAKEGFPSCCETLLG